MRRVRLHAVLGVLRRVGRDVGEGLSPSRRVPIALARSTYGTRRFEFDLYRSDPDSPLAKWFLLAVGVVVVLATAWLVLELISSPILTLGFADRWGSLTSFQTTPCHAPVCSRWSCSIGAFGISLEWFTWVVPGLFLLSLLGCESEAARAPHSPSRAPIRGFPFLGTWSESLDRRATSSSSLRHPARLVCVRLSGRGSDKRLKVRFPRQPGDGERPARRPRGARWCVSRVLPSASARAPSSSPFPPWHPSTGSDASRAAEAAFKALGCTMDRRCDLSLHAGTIVITRRLVG